MALQVGGMFTSAIGAQSQAQSMQNNYNFQAQMGDINARIAESDAQAQLAAGNKQIQNSKLKTAQLKSSQRASMAANGIDLGSDSAVNILSSTDYMGESDALTISANAIHAAGNARMQAVNASNQAIMNRAMASGIDPGQAGMSSLLSSAASVAASWYKYSNSMAD
jgi:hypothetical protein